MPTKFKKKKARKRSSSCASHRGMDAYSRSGVKYHDIDPVKILCQEAARHTIENLWWGNGLAGQLGESAQLVKMPGGGYLAMVLEGLGTKSKVAQAMYELTGDPKYFNMSSVCTCMMIVNDLITSGALPFLANMYLAAGHSRWFKNRERAIAVAEGFRRGCDLAHCMWLGGETPALKGIITQGSYDIAGCALGIVQKESDRIRGDIRPGDVIIGFPSYGPMANGYTLIREIAKTLDNGYLTNINPKGQRRLTFGDAVMKQTPSFVNIIRLCQQAKIRIPYAANVTGHGLRKFMRADLPLTHVLNHVPKPPRVFEFIQKNGPDGVIPTREMFGTYNMGIGFGVWLRPDDAKRFLQLPGVAQYKPFRLGHVEASPDSRKRVLIPQYLDEPFVGEELAIRARQA